MTQQTINVRLEDINDNIPRLASGFDIHVHERATPRLLASLTAIDPDVGINGTVDFYEVNITQHSTNHGMVVLQNSGIITVNLAGEIQLNEELDYENAYRYDIAIRLRDRGTPPLETLYTNITLHVMDVPDNRPQFMFAVGEMVYHNTTDPLLNVGDVIAQVFATDSDFNDNIHYSISSVTWQGSNRNPVPDVSIERGNGTIYSSTEQQIAPDSGFVITVLAYDNSQYNLSAEAMVHITIAPLSLAFVEPYYTTEISEASPPGTNVITVLLEPLSVSSLVEYSLNITFPPGQQYVLTLHHTNLGEIFISTVSELDRETVQNYTAIVTATRRDNEFAQTTVFIRITDINDNPPVFNDPSNAIIYVSELLHPHTTVDRVNVTDMDIGDNSLLQYQIDHITANAHAPFEINVDTGDVILTDQVDYESVSTFSFRVTVTDGGTPPQRSSNVYIVDVIDENDVHPRFSAPAYFGEIYAHIPINDYVRHTVVRVQDEYSSNLLFHISSLSGASHGYAFAITGDPPYYIRVIQSPIEPNIASLHLLELQITVANDNGHGLSSTVPLYISVFTSENLLVFDLSGVTIEEFISCEERQSSICGFREALRDEGVQILHKQVNFYNNSLQRSERDIHV